MAGELFPDHFGKKAALIHLLLRFCGQGEAGHVEWTKHTRTTRINKQTGRQLRKAPFPADILREVGILGALMLPYTSSDSKGAGEAWLFQSKRQVSNLVAKRIVAKLLEGLQLMLPRGEGKTTEPTVSNGTPQSAGVGVTFCT